MFKNILNLKGAQKLTKVEQKCINGELLGCDETLPIGTGCISFKRNNRIYYASKTRCIQG